MYILVFSLFLRFHLFLVLFGWTVVSIFIYVPSNFGALLAFYSSELDGSCVFSSVPSNFGSLFTSYSSALDGNCVFSSVPSNFTAFLTPMYSFLDGITTFYFHTVQLYTFFHSIFFSVGRHHTLFLPHRPITRSNISQFSQLNPNSKGSLVFHML